MINVLYAGRDDQWNEYQEHLTAAFEKSNLNVSLANETDKPETVDYIIYAPNGPLTDFTPYTNAKLVQNLWAGVEVPSANKTLTQPLARMVEPGLTLGMADYVMGHVLRHHLGTDYFTKAPKYDWDDSRIPPLAHHRTVGILGLGELGMFCAEKLASFGFNTCGWSRSKKSNDIVKSYHGTEGLDTVLKKSEILVLLLPNTPETRGVINAETIAKMPKGSAIINPGRGPLIEDDALVAALKSGQTHSATLDVFDVEPLPKDHPYWDLDNVLITPHIGSATRINTACETVAQNINRGENGQPFLYLVDKAAGY